MFTTNTEKFQFWGAAKPDAPVNSFVTSIYKNGDNFFVHSCTNNNITDFYNISILQDEIVQLNKSNIFVEVGDHPIFVYCNESFEYFYGKDIELRKKLLPKLEEASLPLTAKLIISSFFRIYSKTQELLDDYKKSKFVKYLHIDESDYFEKSTLKTEKIESIKKYTDFLKKGDDKHISNYFLIDKENELYFNNKRINLLKITNALNDNKWLFEFLIEMADSKNIYSKIFSDDVYLNLYKCNHTIPTKLIDRLVSPRLKEVKSNKSIWDIEMKNENKLSEYNNNISEKKKNRLIELYLKIPMTIDPLINKL